MESEFKKEGRFAFVYRANINGDISFGLHSLTFSLTGLFRKRCGRSSL